MKLETLRNSFLGYFEQHGHRIVPSAPLVPHSDPTLMFTNAGMVPFKNFFTGKEAIPEPPRATSSQKCVRAGGKHNDLDNVGYTARHHTFFEMMGNFSFGDYFKEQAIEHAWTFLTKTLGLASERLYATVYHTDDEAYNLWKKIAGLPDEKIMRIPTSDNFWSMGDTGPCGPCSEVFYDHGADAAHGEWTLDKDNNDLFGDRFIEIWNLVFMQYEQIDADTRIDLPKPCVDTGMGLERMAAVMQNVHDNYDIDTFQHLIASIEETLTQKATPNNVASFKVIADHLRSSCFLIADGVLPSNEGRGYVLRRIMRRAMRHAHILGTKEPLMYRLVDSLTREMGSAYPELERAQALTKATLQSEEERFRETLGRGLKLLEEQRTSLNEGAALDGNIAFKLYDTYGFPLDLTQDILRSSGHSVDMAGFDAAMAEQKARARAAWKGSGESATADIWLSLHDTHGGTEFLGYTQDTAAASVVAIVADGTEAVQASAGQTVELLFNQTPCYAESGGQIGDTGNIEQDGHHLGTITDVQVPVAGLHVHKVTLNADIAVGDNMTVTIDTERRNRIRANHSATHLLHSALRNILGEHVTQKGSLVTDEKLRFDFSHTAATSSEELALIEAQVNRIIWQNTGITTRLMQPDDAIKAGAMALFGEKYGDEVRVLTMGKKETDIGDYSVELCGGTHVERTGDIGLFKIITEAAIAAGVRRIEAVTRNDAYTYISQMEHIVKTSASRLTVTADEIIDRLDKMLDERKQAQKDIAELKKQLALGGADGGANEEQIGDITYISKHLEGLSPKELRGIAQDFLKGKDAAIVAITTNCDGKGSVVVGLTDDLTAKRKAADYVKIAVETMGGKGGGGRPEMAQGGGPDGSKGEAALQAVKEAI